jgi:hypothetical protein
MSRSTVTDELSRILDSLPKLGEEELEMALERLESLGVELPEGPVRRPGITCPVTQLPLVTACKLSGCPYQINNEWNRNCLLDYMTAQDSESLAVEEIAFLYQENPSKVQNIIETGMASLRNNSMETMGFEGDFHREQPPEVKANLGEDDEFEVTHASLSPGFMGRTNEVLESAVEAELVYRHPAIRLLGILDSIIDEL